EPRSLLRPARPLARDGLHHLLPIGTPDVPAPTPQPLRSNISTGAFENLDLSGWKQPRGAAMIVQRLRMVGDGAVVLDHHPPARAGVGSWTGRLQELQRDATRCRLRFASEGPRRSRELPTRLESHGDLPSTRWSFRPWRNTTHAGGATATDSSIGKVKD